MAERSGTVAYGLRSIYVTPEEWRDYQAAAQATGSITNTWIRATLQAALQQHD